MFSRKKHSHSNLAPAHGLASQSQASKQLQFSTKPQSQSHSQSPQEKQQSQPVCSWAAFGQSPPPPHRDSHTLSTSATAGELILFGGYLPGSKRRSNDLYVISTRDFSTALLKTSGDVPSPRYGHRAVLTSTILLIWGGRTGKHNTQDQNKDDSFYLFNFVSREWTRIVVNGPGPGSRYYHTMTLVGSKLFIFGGRTGERRFNDIWALDLNSLKSNPFWESYEPAPGNEKPLPRASHVSVTTGDRIVIFGGYDGTDSFNDTWSFNISTRKWVELQCTGSIPSPRAGHAAVLIGDVMYVHGGVDGTKLDNLTALNLTTQRWTAFQGIGQSPSGRFAHAMACDGTRVFVLGGILSPGVQADETELIHVLDTQHLAPESDSDAVNPSEKATQLVGRSSAIPPTRGQPHQPSSSLSDALAAHAPPFQKATLGELDHPTSQQITGKQNPSLNSLPSRPTGVSGRSRHVPKEDDGESPTGHHTKLVVPDALFRKEIAQLEDERLIELERQPSESVVPKTERDRHIGQLTDELALKSALLAQVGEEKKRAGLELRNLQAKLDELLLSRDQALEQTQSSLQKATFHAAETNERCQRELAEVHAKLEARDSELAAVRLRLTEAEDGWAKSKAEADTLRAGTQATADLGNTDVDRVMVRLVERVRAMEAEMASLRGNEKLMEDMECRNEG